MCEKEKSNAVYVFKAIKLIRSYTKHLLGNGKIDFDEFLLLIHKYERPFSEETEAREMFKSMDKDGNGFIDTNELKTSFASLGVPLSDDDVRVMMEEAGIKTQRIFFKGF